TASLAIGTGLGAVATGAFAYGVATDDQTAYKIAEYTGYASIPFGLVGGFAHGVVRGAVRAAKSALEKAVPAAVSKGLAGPTSILSTVGAVPVGNSRPLQVFLPRIRLPTRILQIPQVGDATRTQTNVVSGASNLQKSLLLRKTEMFANMRKLGNKNFNRRNHVRT
ncbi:YD repeat-containing protein, partial [Pseudomonas syringae pv. actinidiae ICMP 18807]